MKPRIAIPMPHSGNAEYAQRTLPQYEHAVQQAGGEPVRIPLDQQPSEIMRLIERCDAVVLPGSHADVDPAKYEASPDPRTNQADPKRDTVDELLLQDAYNMRKPVLGICYGLQMLNVYRSGSLRQHIESSIDHANREKNHPVEVDPFSRLANILREAGVAATESPQPLKVEVNSSHHQAAEVLGDGLRISARAPDDVIEALEGKSIDHFVLAVQWHPERSVSESVSQAIFRALVEAAKERHKELAGEIESLPK
jgi:putative glutamine amidotransferase